MKVKGFTLIEVLAVVLIVGILASIAVPQYQKAVVKSRYVKLMPIVKAVKNAEEEYWYMHREYTQNFTDLGFSVKGFAGGGNTLMHGREGMQVTISAEEGRSPMIMGTLTLNGTEVMAYAVYLDHQPERNQALAARRFCVCFDGCANSDNSNHKYFEICSSMTGQSGAASDEEWTNAGVGLRFP